ncbi:hypothetical protein [Streptomyces sp. NPDC056491]|uniref:hypothetical protein n=1 Tax=Streptomyces sp. NPDC056491 TaxID=3345837 RepID=UPI0036760F73
MNRTGRPDRSDGSYRPQGFWAPKPRLFPLVNNSAGGKMLHRENDPITYHDGRPDPQKGRIEEVRDEGPHAVYRVRNEETNEIQVITQGQIE